MLFLIFCNGRLFAQYRIKDSCAGFTLHIEAKNLLSDTIRVAYTDCDYLSGNGLVVLSDGQETFNGKINRATEGILFTNLRSRLTDGPGVIRFIIEPANMTLHFTLVHDSAKYIKIDGSYSQKQKESWEANIKLLLHARDANLNNLVQLNHKRVAWILGSLRKNLMPWVVKMIPYINQ